MVPNSTILTLLAAALLSQQGVFSRGACEGVVAVEMLEGASLRGECSTKSERLRVAITVVNARESSAGTLNSIHLGFCASSVASAIAPPGWTVTLAAEGGGVTFSRGGSAFNEPGIRSRRRLGGFVIELLPGWRYAHQASASWEYAGVGIGVTDVC